MRQHLIVALAAASVAAATFAHAPRALFAQGELTAVDNKNAKPKPAPRLGGHPDLSGYWKGTRDTRPGGNIGKDLPGFKLWNGPVRFRESEVLAVLETWRRGPLVSVGTEA